MGVDVVYTCAQAVENESSQVLATALAICFLLYTGVTVLLASLTLYSNSKLTVDKKKSAGAVVDVKPILAMSS